MHQARERIPEAINHFQQALKIDPSLAMAHLNLGRLYMNQGQRESGVHHLHQFVQLQPYSPEAQELLRRGFDLQNPSAR